MKLFSTEQVSKYHPDKACDQISDAILDAVLKEDPNARVAVETLWKGTTVVIAGEITANINPGRLKAMTDSAVDKVADKLHYRVEKIIDLIKPQSPEIAKAVNTEDGIAAGDQGMMFGYATTESDSLLPWGFDLANQIISLIEDDVDYNPHTILKGDAKVQVTVDLEAPSPEESLHTLLISVCHKEELALDYVQAYVRGLIAEAGINIDGNKVRILINPAGTWTIGGPEADCGLTGRKIVCDQYGGYVPVGGGAFSGKDPSKVDRSAAYMARHLATKAIYKFAEDGLRWIEIQLAYAIGIKEPVSVTFRSNLKEPGQVQEIEEYLKGFDLTPSGIINYLGLTENPNYETRAEGCHYFLHSRKQED